MAYSVEQLVDKIKRQHYDLIDSYIDIIDKSLENISFENISKNDENEFQFNILITKNVPLEYQPIIRQKYQDVGWKTLVFWNKHNFTSEITFYFETDENI